VVTGGANTQFAFDRYDTYEWYLALGPLSNANARYFRGKLPTWNDFVGHPNYDDFWRRQSIVSYVTGEVSVPTLNVAGWWDQEDFFGPLKVTQTFEKSGGRAKELLGWAVEPQDGRMAKKPARPGGLRLGDRQALPAKIQRLVRRPPPGSGSQAFQRHDLPHGIEHTAVYDRWPPVPRFSGSMRRNGGWRSASPPMKMIPDSTPIFRSRAPCPTAPAHHPHIRRFEGRSGGSGPEVCPPPTDVQSMKPSRWPRT
jgi:predicted acyl esterase